jgi:hypothetical protein
MNNLVYTAGKGLVVLAGFTMFAHSRFMPSTLKELINPHPIFKSYDTSQLKTPNNQPDFLWVSQDLPSFITQDTSSSIKE